MCEICHSFPCRPQCPNAEPQQVYTCDMCENPIYSKARHPQAQRLWFETMKKKHGEAILRGAAAIAGGKAGK